jgi:SAM-dependent methyltransferase
MSSSTPDLASQVQVPKEHYFTFAYNHKSRWLTYYYQLQLFRRYKVRTAVEIGPGHGWLKSIAQDLGVSVTTVDIDPALRPDVVASIEKLPFANASFDAVCAFEVLEHMPFEQFPKHLREMARVARKNVIISLPDHQHTLLHFALKVPFLRYLELFIKIPSFSKHTFDGQHYWEVGKRGYSPHKVRQIIREAGFHIDEEFVPSDAPMNRYFVLSAHE